jgi:hypothetical protein
MSYEPKPIDTSHVSLPESIRPLVEQLSEHNHDIWARQRMADGWTWGDSRNDPAKKHPCLVPYDELSEDEKKYDRNSVEEVLKAILALNYRIVKD